MTTANTPITDNTITVSENGREEYLTLVDPNATTFMIDLIDYIKKGWALSPHSYPTYNLVIFEANLMRNSETIRLVKEKLEAATNGRPVWDTAARQENLVKVRAKKAEKIAERKAAEGNDES